MDMCDRRNSFTFLRLILALAVVFSHSYAIGGFGPEPLARWSGGQLQFGFTAVLCFFVVSGFLIAASALRQPLGWFVVNRAARILPGFWMVQCLTALVFAPALILAQGGSGGAYLAILTVGEDSALSYLWDDALFHIGQYAIADLFAGQPAGRVMNGSLWSLGAEVTCYIYLALFAFVGGLRRVLTAVALFAGLYTIHVLACLEPKSILPFATAGEFVGVLQLSQLPFRSLYLAFVAGVLCFRLRAHLPLKYRFFAISLALLACSLEFRAFHLVWPITLPYVVLFLAFKLPFQIVERWGDFSFGIYIYSFPIQQGLVMAGFHQHGVFLFLATSMALSIGAGALSWRYVEAPVLNWVRAVRAKWDPVQLSHAKSLIQDSSESPSAPSPSSSTA